MNVSGQSKIDESNSCLTAAGVKIYYSGMNKVDSNPSWINRQIVRTSLLIALSVSLAALGSVPRSDAQPPAAQTSGLIGTIRSGGFIGAVLTDAKGEQVLYRLKETLPDGSQLVDVRSESITLKSADGTFYNMYIAHDTKTVAAVRPEARPEPSVPPVIRGPSSEQPTPLRHSRVPPGPGDK